MDREEQKIKKAHQQMRLFYSLTQSGIAFLPARPAHSIDVNFLQNQSLAQSSGRSRQESGE